jgi:uncharacterized membrane protein (DUF106 family)
MKTKQEKTKVEIKKKERFRKTFKKEFNKQLLIAITGAFAFLIALSWREPISEAINLLLAPLGERQTIFLKFLGAIIITIIAVLVLLIITKKLKEEEIKT